MTTTFVSREPVQHLRLTKADQQEGQGAQEEEIKDDNGPRFRSFSRDRWTDA